VLNREKLAKGMYEIVEKLFPDLDGEYDIARQKWNELCSDASFVHRSQVAQSSFLVPRWDGSLTDTISIDGHPENYVIIAVDGSQIYPDRHVSGAGCFLVNTGGIVLSYGETSSATFFSQPQVLLPEDVASDQMPFSRDLVDLKREAYELALLVEKVSSHKSPICFIDGSIIFWQLESKASEVKENFLKTYLSCLKELYKNKVLVAGYISMPKSRELVNLIKLSLCRFPVADCISCHSKHTTFPCKQVDRMLDTQVVRFFVKPHQRTTVFYSTSKIVELYPEYLRPAFVYCDVGSEIARLEVPTWIAQDTRLLNQICSVAIDQSVKGRGYPVCLAEAHEQAVVKGNDREFFYHLLHKIGMDYNRRVRLSEKAIKKRVIGI